MIDGALQRIDGRSGLTWRGRAPRTLRLDLGDALVPLEGFERKWAEMEGPIFAARTKEHASTCRAMAAVVQYTQLMRRHDGPRWRPRKSDRSRAAWRCPRR